jgi:hypothetical protein
MSSLQVSAARAHPLAPPGSQLLEVPTALDPLFPEGGIRRGSTVAVGPSSGGASLALLLAGEVSRTGWVAAVGLPSIGPVAAVELGVRLDHLALVPFPGEQWHVVVASLLDGVEMVLLDPGVRARAGDARRLSARARERGAVMVLVDVPGWPQAPDICLTATQPVWEGLGHGHGRLWSRRLEVISSGRRAAARMRRGSIWLPSPGGVVQPVGQSDDEIAGRTGAGQSSAAGQSAATRPEQGPRRSNAFFAGAGEMAAPGVEAAG